MTEHDATLNRLQRTFRRRIELLLAVQMLAWGLAGAGLLAIVLILIDRLSAWYVTPEQLGVLAVLGALGGVLYARYRRPSEQAVAQTVERRMALKERLSTALALREDRTHDPEFRTLVTHDAVEHLSAVAPSTLFPWRFARPHRLALSIWGVALLLFVLPALPWFYTPEQREERLAMELVGKALQEEAKSLQRDPALTDTEIAKQVAKNMERLGIEMEKHRISKKEALIRANKLEEELKRVEKTLAREEANRRQQAMAQAAQAMKSALAKRSEAERQAAERAREKVAQGTPRDRLTPQERAALQREEQLSALAKQLAAGNLPATAEQLRQLGEQLAQGQMSPEAQRQLAQSMQQLAQSMQQADPQLAEAARNAAQQLAQGTPQGQQQASKALQQARQSSSSASQRMSQASQGMQQGRQQMASGKCAQCGSASCPGGGQCRGGGRNGNGSGNGNGNGNGNNNRQNSVDGPRRPGGGGGTSGGTGGGGHESNRPNPRETANFSTYQEHSQQQQSGRIYSTEFTGSPDQANASTVNDYGVYTHYKKSAESAMNAEQVPASEKQRVKSYFEALDPSRQ